MNTNTSSDVRYDGINASTIKRAKLGLQPKPVILEIQPSPICQLKCSYCHSESSPTNKLKQIDKLLSLNEYGFLFDEFRGLDGEDLVISGGGEPLLYPDHIGLVQKASISHLRVHLYTNGLAEEYFSPRTLSLWFPKITSIRFSLHPTIYRSEKLRLKFFNAIRSVMQFRIDFNLQTLINIALLVDQYTEQDINDLFSDPTIARADYIELRPSIPYSSKSNLRLQAAHGLAISKGIHEGQLNTRFLPDDFHPVPTRCYALYRSLVIDSFSGFRICCLRSHLAPEDISYLGSTRINSITKALSIGVNNMTMAGKNVCAACSFRDSYFSSEIIENKRRTSVE